MRQRPTAVWQKPRAETLNKAFHNICFHRRLSHVDQSSIFGTSLVICHSPPVVRHVVMVQTHAGHLSHANRLTVLLSSEQESWHQTVRRLLEPQGVETLAARSGREALSLMESRPIHVAVLDQAMPQLNGLQVVKLMREMPIEAPPAILLAN